MTDRIVQISVGLEIEQVNRLEDEAEEEGISKSAIARRRLEEAWEADDEPEGSA